MKKRVRDLKDKDRNPIRAAEGIRYDRTPVERPAPEITPLTVSGKRTTLGDLLDRSLDRMEERLRK